MVWGIVSVLPNIAGDSNYSDEDWGRLDCCEDSVTGVEIGPLCRMASGSFWGRSIPAGWTAPRDR